jgi:hypothetical protein
MATWQFGGFAPDFVGPDLSPYNIVQTFSGTVLNGGALFSLDFGTKSYSNQGATVTGLTLNTSTGVYSAAGAVTPGTYAMVLRCSGSDTPPSYTDYGFSLVVNTTGGGNPPVFTGPINDQVQAGDSTFDSSTFATGESSYSISALPPGFSFNTSTGLLTITSATSGYGIFGPFTITYINAAGSKASNPFFYTVLIPGGGGSGDFSDSTLQLLLDPLGNGTGIRIVKRHQPADMSRVCYFVDCRQTNRGRSRGVEVLATDTAVTRANKIFIATSIPAQPIWPLPT